MFRRLAGDGPGFGTDSGGGGPSSSGQLDLVEEARRPFADAATDINGALVYLVRVARTPGCQIGYTDHTARHQLVCVLYHTL